MSIGKLGRKVRGGALLLLILLPGAAIAATSGVIVENLNRDVRPQDDMFRFANGHWLRTVAIPADRSSYGVQQLMMERALLRQRAIAEAAIGSADPQARKVGALYASFMDEPAIDAAGLAPIRSELATVDAIADRRGIAFTMGRLDRLGMIVPISTYVAPDARDARRYALWLSQNDLGLPGKDYFLSDEAGFADKRVKFRHHVATMLGLAGDAQATRHADAIVALETEIARLQWLPVDRRDPQKTYNPKSPAALAGLAPGFDWPAYFTGAGMTASPATTIARQPDYLAGVAALTASVPIATWKAYFRYLLLAGTAPYLPKAFATQDFAFNQGVLRGTSVQPERWKRATQLVDRLIGEASGSLYVERHFSPRTKAAADALVKNLFAAYAERIRTLDWMQPATKAQALAKLAAMDVKIGYPSQWRDYGALDIRATDLAGNVLRARQFEFDRQHRRVGQAVDRNEWQMAVAMPDAYYAPLTNEIAFPAGILQPPLFDPDADDAYNYGSTGATIGHEMSHGFDNRGSRYDAGGSLRDWWTAEDHAEYDRRTARLVEQFDGFEPLPGTRVNGKLVLSENIADLAGLSVAWQAYLTTLKGKPAPVIDGLSGAQRFMVGYAQGYLGKRRDENLMALLKGNPHPPEEYRVNGILAHLPAFYEAFDLKPGDAMYLPPDKRADIW